MKTRAETRSKRKSRVRKKVVGMGSKPRLAVFRSLKHTYAQLILDDQRKVVTSASTLDKDIQARAKTIEVTTSKSKSAKSVAAARAVGLALAERSLKANVSEVVFDRAGYAFHGRVKAVAEGAREGGLKF